MNDYFGHDIFFATGGGRGSGDGNTSGGRERYFDYGDDCAIDGNGYGDAIDGDGESMELELSDTIGIKLDDFIVWCMQTELSNER